MRTKFCSLSWPISSPARIRCWRMLHKNVGSRSHPKMPGNSSPTSGRKISAELMEAVHERICSLAIPLFESEAGLQQPGRCRYSGRATCADNGHRGGDSADLEIETKPHKSLETGPKPWAGSKTEVVSFPEPFKAWNWGGNKRRPHP